MPWSEDRVGCLSLLPLTTPMFIHYYTYYVICENQLRYDDNNSNWKLYIWYTFSAAASYNNIHFGMDSFLENTCFRYRLGWREGEEGRFDWIRIRVAAANGIFEFRRTAVAARWLVTRCKGGAKWGLQRVIGRNASLAKDGGGDGGDGEVQKDCIMFAPRQQRWLKWNHDRNGGHESNLVTLRSLRHCISVSLRLSVSLDLYRRLRQRVRNFVCISYNISTYILYT